MLAGSAGVGTPWPVGVMRLEGHLAGSGSLSPPPQKSLALVGCASTTAQLCDLDKLLAHSVPWVPHWNNNSLLLYTILGLF